MKKIQMAFGLQRQWLKIQTHENSSKTAQLQLPIVQKKEEEKIHKQ
jgi:hypothetical protein